MKRDPKWVAVNTRDHLFWIALAQGWLNWRTALAFVQSDTVVRWHRDWLRRRLDSAVKTSTLEAPID